MKKTFVLMIALVCSLLLAEYSYAYWSEDFDTDEMAESDELSVIFTEEEVIDKPLYVISNNELTDKSFSINLINLYPGAKYITKVVILNNGSIPAILEFVELLDSNGNALSPYIRVTLEFITNPDSDDHSVSVVLNDSYGIYVSELELALEASGVNSSGEVLITVEVLDNAPMEEVVDFTLQLNFAQCEPLNVKSNKGNHYGNDKPDDNNQDDKNKHDGEDTKDDHHNHKD